MTAFDKLSLGLGRKTHERVITPYQAKWESDRDTVSQRINSLFNLVMTHSFSSTVKLAIWRVTAVRLSIPHSAHPILPHPTPQLSQLFFGILWRPLPQLSAGHGSKNISPHPASPLIPQSFNPSPKIAYLTNSQIYALWLASFIQER